MSYPQPPQPDGEPQPPVRPNTLIIACELWIVVLLGKILSSVALYGSVDHEWRETKSKASQAVADALPDSFLPAFIIGSVVELAVAVALVWFTRNGFNVARFILTLWSTYTVVSAATILFHTDGARWGVIPAVISGVAALGAAYLLIRPETDKYCRQRKAARAAATRQSTSLTRAYTNPAQHNSRQQNSDQSGNTLHHPGNAWPSNDRGDDPNRSGSGHNDGRSGTDERNQPYDPRTYSPVNYGATPPANYAPRNDDSREEGASQPRRADETGWDRARGENVRERDIDDPQNRS